MRTAVFAYSRRGCETARRVLACLDSQETEAYTMERFREPGFGVLGKPSRDFYGALFQKVRAMIFVGSVGLAVREIAPHLRGKTVDPAVLVLDESGRFVIPVLSGHIGGANALARTLAERLGATAVITTATDVNGRFSVDSWAVQAGCAISSLALAKAVSAAVLEGEVPMQSEFPVTTPLPRGLVPGRQGPLGIYIGVRREAPFERTLHLVPRILRLGLGCRRGTPAETIREAVAAVLEKENLDPGAVAACASVDLKAAEPGLLTFCREAALPVRFYTAAELRAVAGDFTPSDFVKTVTGVDNVCERAALAEGGTLLVRKTARNGVTVALGAEDWEVRFE